jgi:hypothetical protein
MVSMGTHAQVVSGNVWPPTVQLTVKAVNRGDMPVQVERITLGSAKAYNCDDLGLSIVECGVKLPRTLDPGQR